MTAELKERIVDVAIEEFTLMGLKFTMNDIARQLGISKKTIYTIFDSKKDVLEGIADRYSADFRRMQEDIEADRSLNNKQKFERILLASGEVLQHRSEPNLRAVRQVSEAVQISHGRGEHGWQIAEKYLRDGIRCGEFKEVSVPVFMSMVRGTVERFMQSSVLYDNGMTYEQGKQEMVRILMKGIEANE